MDKLNAKPLEIDGVVLLTPTRFEDSRGYFAETFNLEEFSEAIGSWVEFVQDNESKSKQVGTIRGLHFQREPFAQGKLVRVVQGSVLDVAVDIRTGSPTFGQHVTAELSATNGHQLWVSPGMAHGFCTLEPDTIISYKVTNYYDTDSDRSLRWDDPRIGISWPAGLTEPQLSEKDANAPSLTELEERGDVFS